ncbi:serine/threonine-protein kinase HAL4/sat4 [Mortierella sp. AD094]|nr:serine/threonine-protein kinase HAL4/sat4 [Mortierella sp. AD094]
MSAERLVSVAPPAASSPALVQVPTLAAKVTEAIHKLPEPTGFRARFLKRLTSSPNLHTVVYPMATPLSSSAPGFDKNASRHSRQQQFCSQCDENQLDDVPPSPYSPLASDFEHENSCPAGQRIQERRSGHPRSTTTPKQPVRMPTLQSKYGVPGRELGAGTQVQVMLLRVKSSKRMKNSQPFSPEAKQLPQLSQRTMLSAGDGVDSLLSPRSRSGTLMTTTEDEVTPEQREAYRKRLLRKTSTSGLSIGDGGLIYAIKKFRPPKATETHRQYLKKVCAEFCISTSMDHENIIKVIDLVRDQPGQELFGDDLAEQQKQQQYEEEGYMRTVKSSQQYGRESGHSPVGAQGPKDDYRDCSCPREHRRRVRVIKSADELRSHNSESQMIAAAKKKKQQQDQELRQKEVLRLKQQKQREKQQANQLRLDQFPEYCMHRDLKPENILIDATGRILKITDFGIANVFKSVGDPIPLPCSGIIGSEPYIAPEEFYQEEYDPRAVDVWACGIIFYVMFYSAMPWARADRKKDARFARYINDIMAHRHSEPQRRLQYERRQLRNNSIGSGSLISQGSLSFASEAFSRPHEALHHRQFPPYQPADYSNNSCNSPSSGSGSPCSSHGIGETESPNSSANCSPVTPIKASLDRAESFATTTTTTAAVIPPVVYNTYSYNGYIGGHEFLDRMETPGCRRIMYAILEPDARKRVTIDQVVNDEWVSRIRYCTDCPVKQEQQATAMYGQGASLSRYLQLSNGELPHQHATPKKVRSKIMRLNMENIEGD